MVEDENDLAGLLYKLLTADPLNHHVSIATNGQIALDLFSRNKFDLISLDYIMPGEKNGMDVYREIRSKNEEVPIIFVSGNFQFLESMNGLKKNDKNVDHLSKPFTNVEYVGLINKWIGRKMTGG